MKMDANLKANLAHCDSLIAQLMQQFEQMELQTQNANQTNHGMNNPSTHVNNPSIFKNKPGGSAIKKKWSKAKYVLPCMVYTPPPKKNATNSSSKKKTPVHQHTGCSANPMSTKKSPLQMNKQNHPAEFEHTKVIPA